MIREVSQHVAFSVLQLFNKFECSWSLVRGACPLSDKRPTALKFIKKLQDRKCHMLAHLSDTIVYDFLTSYYRTQSAKPKYVHLALKHCGGIQARLATIPSKMS